MGLMTIEEFIKDKKVPFVSNKSHVYLLIKMGALKSIKKGRKRYILDNGNEIDNFTNSEKRNKKITIKVPEIFYKLLFIIADKEKQNEDDIINSFNNIIDDILPYLQDEEKYMEIKIPTVQLNNIIAKISKINERVENLNKNKRLNNLRISEYISDFVLLLILFLMLKWKSIEKIQ